MCKDIFEFLEAYETGVSFAIDVINIKSIAVSEIACTSEMSKSLVSKAVRSDDESIKIN